MRIAAATLWLCAAVASQSPVLHVQLAARTGSEEPAAWGFAREHVMTRLPSWPEGVDADGALRLTLEASGRLEARVDEAPVENAYLRFSLVDGAEVLVRGECDARGRERWWVDATVSARGHGIDGHLAALVEEAFDGALTIDVAALTGNLIGAAAHGDPVSELLTVGAAECGTVEIVALPAGDDSTTWRVVGQSGGGMLLPAVIALLAEEYGVRSSAEGADAELERWILTAATTRGDEQLEAVRQMSRFDDRRVVRALESLLYAEDDVRLAAIHALVRLGATESIGAVLRAADPEVEGSAALAAGAVWELLPESVREELSGGESREMPAGARTATARQLVLALALGLAATLGACLAVRRRLVVSHGGAE